MEKAHGQRLQEHVVAALIVGPIFWLITSSASVKLVLGRRSSQLSWRGQAWIWLCLSGSVLFFAGGLTNAVRVIAMQKMERVTIDKLRGSAYLLEKKRQGQQPLLIRKICIA
ncbi:hypothetical protein ZIOFF_074689 [Zingiber officinale]|uniref:Uncharacterized protein n=1 Tax=Zingiber officinale TaxID=94328 RepID=A0A8J5BWF0_ZINOF|nr:hypothetical protein ZIOFF_074689 [Zingiber officinale]